jgi:hypothetical protein
VRGLGEHGERQRGQQEGGAERHHGDALAPTLLAATPLAHLLDAPLRGGIDIAGGVGHAEKRVESTPVGCSRLREVPT